MTTYRFESPYVLLLLLPAWLIAFQPWRRKRVATVMFSSAELLRTVPRTMAQRFKRFLPLMKFVGLSCLVVALARPQYGKEEYRVKTDGIAIQMVIDRSGSMQAMDFEIDNEPVNRLDAVKKVFQDFVLGANGLPGRRDDAIGLIAFGGFADSLCPLTLDHTLLMEILKTVEIGGTFRDSNGDLYRIPGASPQEQATAIGDAIALAIERIRSAKAVSKVIILLSDGESNAGQEEPLAAAEAAKALGIRIHTIGIGSEERVALPGRRVGGMIVGSAQQVGMDEEQLKAIAEKTGGMYFNAKNSESLAKIYKEIDKLERTTHESPKYTEYRELFLLPLALGLCFAFFPIVADATRMRTLT